MFFPHQGHFSGGSRSFSRFSCHSACIVSQSPRRVSNKPGAFSAGSEAVRR